ncbi:MAG TPA: AMP-binding protein [Stellaceae bacterium]|nr:AMP-binding protein [Stellaceae bacterium]
MALAETRERNASVRAAADLLDTFPKLLFEHAAKRGARPAFREKDYGIWQSWSWAEAAREIEEFAAGLAALGFKRGDKLAVAGDNRPRLYWAISAAQCLGGVPVPVYQDSVAAEMKFVLDHAEARFAIAENQEQVDKLISVRPELPGLAAIVFHQPRGMRHYNQEFLLSYERVQENGRARLATDPDFVKREVAKGNGADLAIILYTSGTTGTPKGVMLTYDNVRKTAANAVAFDRLGADEEVLSYLPMAWVGDHVFSFGQAYVAGYCISCPESGATVMTDLKELGPTYFFSPPRVWESILTQVMIRIEDSGWLKRRLFHYFMGVARRAGGSLLDGRPVSFKDRLLYRIGDGLIYGPLKNVLGMSRIRVAYTAGEAIGPDIFNFFRSLGINVKQLYGMTEAAVFLCMQPDGAVKLDTVGMPIKDVELLIADSGEVLYRSPGVFAGYYRNPEATAETKRKDGWTHSGDAGFLGDDGQLRIIDRAKDVGKLKDGTLFAPKFLENKLKFFSTIKEAVVFGAGRDYVAAIINIDPEAVGNWAEKRGIASGSYQELASLEPVYDLIAECVDKVNRDLAAEPHLTGSQIRRFLILHKELDADDGELTRTRKVRRSLVGERFKPLVDALYSSADSGRIESEVTFEDGRKGLMRATLRIRDVAPAPPLRQAG